MRPAVSTNFLAPVKNGWHWEQISTRMLFLVARVWMTLPQAQVMMAWSYAGWILAFISGFPFNKGGILPYLFIFCKNSALVLNLEILSIKSSIASAEFRSLKALRKSHTR